MRVLVAWEEGAHLGHTTRLRAVAAALRERGAAITWAVPQHRAPTACALAIAGEQLMVVRTSRPAPARWQLPRSYADILAGLGFSGAKPLQAVLAPWLGLMASCRPDLVVLDYAPVALLATYLAGIRAIQISNGFDSPPAHCPPFGYRLRGPLIDQQNARLVEAVEVAIGSLRPGPMSLAGMFTHPLRVLDVCPASDPYGHLRAAAGERVAYVGPLGSPTAAETPCWRSGPDASRIFAYLRGPRARHAAEAMRGLPISAICVWPDATEQDIRELSTEALEVRCKLVDGAAALAEADLVVNYGSSGLVTKALLAGKPQLMLPADVEKWLISRRVAAAGAGVMLDDFDAPAIWATLGGMVSRLGLARAGCAEVSKRERGQLVSLANVLDEVGLGADPSRRVRRD